MITSRELTVYLENLLECSLYVDHTINGLQIEGKAIIHSICTAVTASATTIDIAIAKTADALIVHHGYFWNNESSAIIGIKRQRIAKLLANNIALYGYHLPLDCHPTLGNNACIAKVLELTQVHMHTVGKNPRLLWTGKLPQPTSAQQLVINIQKKLNRKPLLISSDKSLIKTIAWCTGAAQDFIELAADLKVDAYLSGEISERTYYQAKELGLHYFACGHHATELYGIQQLGIHLANKFQLQHCFIDSDNPI